MAGRSVAKPAGGAERRRAVEEVLGELGPKAKKGQAKVAAGEVAGAKGWGAPAPKDEDYDFDDEDDFGGGGGGGGSNPSASDDFDDEEEFD